MYHEDLIYAFNLQSPYHVWYEGNSYYYVMLNQTILVELNSKNITEHGDSSYRDYLSERIESNFEFRLVDSHNIKQIIKGIKTSRSNGHDGISSELLKLISNEY